MKNNGLLHSETVHYRLAKHHVTGKVFAANVQWFDYDGYDFVNDDCYEEEAEADLEAAKHNQLPLLTPCCGANLAPRLFYGDFEGFWCGNDDCNNSWDQTGAVENWFEPTVQDDSR